MNRELEGLILALEAILQAGEGTEAERLRVLFDSRIDDVLSRHRSLSRSDFLRALDRAHRHWVQAQKKPPSLPPKA